MNDTHPEGASAARRALRAVAAVGVLAAFVPLLGASSGAGVSTQSLASVLINDGHTVALPLDGTTSITVTNAGTTPWQATGSISLTAASARLALDASTCTGSVAPAASCHVILTTSNATPLDRTVLQVGGNAVRAAVAVTVPVVVAAGSDGTTERICASVDPTFADPFVCTTGTAGDIRGMAGDGTQWVAAGDNHSSGNQPDFWYTADPTGQTGWTQTVIPALGTAPRAIAVNQGNWVSVGDNTLMTTSTPGTGSSWTTPGTPGFISFNAYGIAARGTTSSDVSWVVAGHGFTTGHVDRPVLDVTSDPTGATGWGAATFTGSPPPSTASFQGVAYNGRAWVAVGYAAGHGIIYTPTQADAASGWHSAGSIATTELEAVAWNGSAWLATDPSDQTTWSTTDPTGASGWTEITGYPGGRFEGPGWNGAAWIVVDQTGATLTSTAAVPTAASDWTTVPSVSSEKFNAVATSQGLPQVPEPTTVGVVSDANPSVSGESVTFTATVSADSGLVPDGDVIFTVDGADTTAPIVGGVASLARADLPAGDHTVSASYAGTGGFDSSSASLASVQHVSVAPTTTTAPTTLPSTTSVPTTTAPNGGEVAGAGFEATTTTIPDVPAALAATGNDTSTPALGAGMLILSGSALLVLARRSADRAPKPSGAAPR